MGKLQHSYVKCISYWENNPLVAGKEHLVATQRKLGAPPRTNIGTNAMNKPVYDEYFLVSPARKPYHMKFLP